MPILAIIGIDGCGKTTQAKMLTAQLTKEGYKAMYVQPVFAILNMLPASIRMKIENTLSPRKACTASANSPRRPIIRAITSIFNGILGYPYALLSYILLASYSKRGRVVVCDRYFYQFFFDLYGDKSQAIIRIFPSPDVTYFLQGDLNLIHSRMNNPADLAVARSYYADVDNLLKSLAQKQHFIEIDASLAKEATGEIILRHFKKFLKDGGKLTEANYA